VRIGIDVSQHQLLWPELLDRVRLAEDAGFDGAWVFDHFKSLYGPSDGPCFEAWALLAALAAATSRIRLGALVTGVTYRHPSVLAAEAVTVDHVSSGRLELGMGAAWFADEHEELGIDFPRPGERISRLDEALEVITRLMTEDGAAFDGRYFQLRKASYWPRPVQQPYPPVWVGGGGERRMMPLAARWADMWHGFGSVAALARKSRLLDRLAYRGDLVGAPGAVDDVDAGLGDDLDDAGGHRAGADHADPCDVTRGNVLVGAVGRAGVRDDDR
jgi:F420-dependent oxidoreductase-like protein